MFIKQLLAQLSERLPELEWKLGNLNHSFNIKILPKGLFRLGMEAEPRDFIAEIRQDIQILEKRQDLKSAHFLAERIQQKINVLVTVCQRHGLSVNADTPCLYNMDRLTTRQQWLQSLSQDINTMEQQLQALQSASQKMLKNDKQAQINIQAEIGKAEKRLTLARESYAKMTNY